MHANRQALDTGSGMLEAAQGVWRSEESGWLLQITPDRIIRWQETPVACYPTRQDGPTLMGQIEYRYFTPHSSHSARFEYLPSDGHAIFRRIPFLPPACHEDPDVSPEAVFDVFSSVFQRHYAFFEQRGVDWAGNVAAAKAANRPDMSDADLLGALAGLLEPLQDSHTKLLAEIDGQTQRVQFGLGTTLPRVRNGLGETPWLIGLLDNLMAYLDEGAVQAGNERFVRGTINGHIGYIQIFTMGGFTTEFEPGTPEWSLAEIDALHALFDDALMAFEDTDALILDLSNNRGGYDAITRAIASRFTDAPFDAYTVRTEWDGAPQITYTIDPYQDGPRYTKPVYIITSDVTVSGGEITTLMLRQLPHIKTAGQTSRGAFSTPLAKPLPNGWYLELSNEIFADADGTSFEGKGIPPDIELPLFGEHDLIESHLASLKLLVACIEDSSC
ncbi:MAG: S41 family peptidase [Hyphomonas sp.]|uniref:S41 family peptidase n=1 Tax=Hyphomonas sp. TaxID=87 RepID=UPI0035290A1F